MVLGKALLGTTFAALLALSMIEVAACSSNSPPAATHPDSRAPVPQSSVLPVCTDGGLTIAFNPMYSAFDGTHLFQIPAVVRGSNGQVTWSADTSMVEMQADPELPNEVMIQVLNSGTTSIVVQSMDGKCASAPLTITPATVADWKIGNARYYDGTSLHLQAAATGGSGSPLEQGSGGPACNNCHGETATASAFTDVSHTPEQTGGFSDDDLLNIILHGTFPPGAYFDKSIVSYPYWQMFHRWSDIQPDQQTGIIVFLRSLPPAPQKGAVNFGAFLVDASFGGGDATDESGDAPSDAAESDSTVADSSVGDSTLSDASASDAMETGVAADVGPEGDAPTAAADAGTD